MADKPDFVAEAQKQLQTWTAEMKKMQTQMMEANMAAQEQMLKQMEALNEQRKQAEAQIEQLGKANVENMRQMQSQVMKVWEDMEKSMEDARKKFMG